MDDVTKSSYPPTYPTLESMLAVSMTRTVRVLLPSALMVLIVFAAFYAVTLPHEAAVVLVPFSLATAALAGALWIFVQQQKETDTRIHVVALVIGCLVAAKSLAHIWLTGSPIGIGTLIFLLILAGSAFVKERHLCLLSGFVAVGLGLCFLRSGVSANSLYLTGVAGTAAGVGIAVQGARLQAFRALHSAHEQILRQALRDQLTGLVNRTSLMQRLRECLQRCDAGTGDHFAVTYLDLDGLKRVNDVFGHSCGDALLAAVGERLRAGLDGNHFAARVGGDEFVVVSEGIPGKPLAVAAAHRIHNAICGAVVRDKLEIPVSASFGWAWSGDGFDAADEILAAADRGMYVMKRARQHTQAAGSGISEGIGAMLTAVASTAPRENRSTQRRHATSTA